MRINTNLQAAAILALQLASAYYAVPVRAGEGNPVYDFVVSQDSTGDFSSINEAILAAAGDGSRTNIFIRKGTYHEKVFIGDRYVTSDKVISLVGEDADSVIITWNDYLGKEIDYPGKGTITADGTTCPTMTVTSPDFYMENITVMNPSTSGQAVALYQSGDRQVLKNCKILGNQDTHRTKKGRRYFYFRTTVEGGVDFIYAGGTCYFYQCRIVSNKSGYITAPEDVVYQATLSSGKTLRYGFFFRDCDIVSDGAGSGSVYLGRPWQPECGSVFLECRLGDHINPQGWQAWDGHESSSCFAEYKNLNADGSAPADVSGRVSWSMQLGTGDLNDLMLLSTIYAAVSPTSVFDPVPSVVAPPSPQSLNVEGDSLSWDTVENADGYLIYANGAVIGFSDSGNYTDSLEYGSPAEYTVRTVGPLGNLSAPDGETEDFSVESINQAINSVIIGVPEHSPTEGYRPELVNGSLRFERPTHCMVYSVTGRLIHDSGEITIFDLDRLGSGLFIFRASDELRGSYTFKLVR